LKNALSKEGVRGAVKFVNSLSPHRFTSLYRFHIETLRNIAFFDRENPDVEKCDDIPVQASYCVFIRDHAANFLLPDAGTDDRVKDHPKRTLVQRYCGVPLLDKDGKLFGSICHFDFEPGSISDKDVELLEMMGDVLKPTF
jgi:GAF domain-containing protein